MKFGNVFYNDDNQTINISVKFNYEIDCESVTANEALKLLSSKDWIKEKDMNDLKKLFAELKKVEPELPIFKK